MIELSGKTAGIIGLGRIGQTTARILKAMDMRVLAYDAHPNDAGRETAEYVDLDTLFASSDVIFLHCPLFPETEGIINKKYRQDERRSYYHQQQPRTVSGRAGFGRRAEERKSPRGRTGCSLHRTGEKAIILSFTWITRSLPPLISPGQLKSQDSGLWILQ